MDISKEIRKAYKFTANQMERKSPAQERGYLSNPEFSQGKIKKSGVPRTGFEPARRRICEGFKPLAYLSWLPENKEARLYW